MPLILRAVDDVVEDRLGKRIGPLEHHADAAADLRHVLVENVLAVERDLAFDPGIAQGFVDAVQIAQKSGFAAARGPDQRGDFVGGELERDIVQGAGIFRRRN